MSKSKPKTSRNSKKIIPPKKVIKRPSKIKNNKKLHSLYPIDMSNTNEAELVKQLMKQMTTVGFCLITNVPGHNEESLMKAIKDYHDLPLEVKMKMAPKHMNPESKHIY